ncbi:release factor glutamine methyltransferase [Erythrobacter litoralis]|jgi:release factor glutamine methyltransferase|uniref:Release factor glutamine methyltransferase n=1 Tax=Erythrobacter litoralis TaxID=39960 RepID=A0A074M848_9SPHN|nr:peptide chain release factor N(5)-glutamine methyltransferase [Erythrobacter litoralis]AOL22300.1 release factor glutamine methyltransferase [Erythrobacter litoralis]KEO89589.1 SAM-dependent methyltransferase [Erythrobacter litoralis]MEE4339439.1 peptide chain release factor N(5)-glutamine methyltransferase [Erythrobacter sp.]
MSSAGDAIRGAAARLAATSDTARLDAEILMAHALRCSRSDMLLRRMPDPSPAKFERLVERRLGHEPVAYIIGVQEFFGREFRVDREVLIPRPDSETAIEAALDVLGDRRSGEIVDLGTGSGALLLTLLAERPGFTGIGLDRSEGALRVARDNAERLGLAARARFHRTDWTMPGPHGDAWYTALPLADLVIANPPYVEADADLAPDVREHEPAGALFAGADGLDDYRIIIPALRAMLIEGGAAVLEIGARQGDEVTGLAQAAGFAVEIRNDLAARPRAVILS